MSWQLRLGFSMLLDLRPLRPPCHYVCTSWPEISNASEKSKKKLMQLAKNTTEN